MTDEEAIQLVDSVLGEKHLNDVQEQVFRQCWEGLKYPEIAIELGYDHAYLRRVGCELWRLLSEGFGEKVTKSNFRAVLRRHAANSAWAGGKTAQEPKSIIQESVSTDPNFVGREGAIAQITSLASQGAKIITICAPGGVGKTTLAWQYLNTHGFDTILEIWMAKEIQSINSVESEVERWIQQNFGEEPGRDFGVNLERLRQKLRAPNQRIGILIDNLEPALDKNGRFIENRRPYVDFLRVLADPGARSLTLITSRERLCEPSVEIRDYRLEGLKESTWQEFFSSRDIKTNTSALKEMHHAYGGNAKVMQILSSAIQIDFDGNLENFWQLNQANLLLNPTLENLVSEQFNRLQEIHPEAYKLLCRLGCFRYQDVPTVPFDAVLCLLWDVEEASQRRVIRDLEARSLIEVKNLEYWLHPVIKTEAIRRLISSNNYIQANQISAIFWTNTIKTIENSKDALTALEAYYHYLAINRADLACRVITRQRKNKWKIDEFLGCAFYRLGLLDQITFVGNQIVEKLSLSNDFDLELGRVHNILGDSLWLSGKIHNAILHHQKSKEMAQNIGLKRLEMASLLNIGLCKLDLWELGDSATYFHKVIAMSKQEENTPYKLVSYYCLGLIKSHLNLDKEAAIFIDISLKNISLISWGTWSRGHSFLYLGLTYKNLGNIEKSLEMYSKAINYAKDSHFSQLKAKSLIAIAELKRINSQFEQAFSYYLEATRILTKIGAIGDLAEAYFQLGLTYQAMSEFVKGLEYRDMAIKLFEKMEAPRQVERVRLAFESYEE